MLPNIDSWESRLLGSFWYGLELPRHLFHFSPRSLRCVTQSIGFEEVSLITPATTYVERSASYLTSRAQQAIGLTPVPMARRGARSIPSKLVHKALRISVFEPFGGLAGATGAGASMEAVFAKLSAKRESNSSQTPLGE